MNTNTVSAFGTCYNVLMKHEQIQSWRGASPLCVGYARKYLLANIDKGVQIEETKPVSPS